MTLAEAIKEYVGEATGPVTAEMVKQAIQRAYPGQWKISSIQAHMYGCVANNRKAYVHYPSLEKFLYRNSDGTFVLYDEKMHDHHNEWMPGDEVESEEGPEELIESSISLERDLEDHLVHNLAMLEPGMTYVERQVSTDVGRVDIEARDANGVTTVIEVKVGEAKDAAVGQIARYLGWYQQQGRVRGILVACDFPEATQYAAKVVADLKLIKYRIQFMFEDV